MLLHHVVDAEGAGALLAGFGEEDEVAVQLDIHALEEDEDHEARDHVRLVIARAAGVDDAVLVDGAEGVDGPLVALHAHHVGVAHDQQGLLLAGALDARHQIGSRGVQREQFAGDAVALQDGLYGFGGLRFVARRITSVDLEKGGEVGENLRLELAPVHGGARLGRALRGERGGESEQTKAETS